MSLHFDITGDNSNFLRKLDEARNGIRSTTKQIEESGTSIEQMFGRMAKGAAALGAGFSAQQFASQIMKVRGEFQQLEVAFNTMLGSEEKADALMQQLVRTAATTPFDLQSVAGGAKQLLAYGTAADDVNGTLIRLGDIAAGLSIPLGDLVYLYGTTMAQGRLYTQDFNQFTGRGIPMIGELAKQFGVAESEVKKLVESGRVGFPEVQKVIESLTNEGGKFGGLMEAQSKTITGQISNIEDAIDTMFNNIGKANEGFINDALSGVSYLIENYEDIGKIILELVGTYGAYRVALMVTTALQALQASGITALTVKEAVHYGWLVITKKAQDALNLSMLKNPYILAAIAVAGLAYGIYKLATAENEAEKATRMYNEAIDEQQKKQEEYKEKINSLIKAIDDNNKSEGERLQAFEDLKAEYPTVLNNLLTEAEYLKDVLKYKKLIAEEDNNRAKQSDEEILEETKRKLKDYQNARKNGTSTTLVDMDGNGWASDNVEDAIKAQQEIVNKALIKASAHDVTSYLGNIKDLNNSDISSAIDGISTSLKALGKSGDDAIAIVSELGGEFSKSQLLSIKNALETEQKSRSGEKKAGTEWLSFYKKAYKDADKAYNDFLKSKQVMSEADRDKELKRLKELRDTAKATYETKGGSASSDTKQESSSEKLRKEQEKYNLLMNKQALDQARSSEDLQTQVDEARINAMREGSIRTLEQMKIDHSKEMQQLDRQQEDLLRKKIEEERAAFDAKEDEKKAKDPKHVKQTFDGSKVTLSQSEKDAYSNQKMYLSIQQAGETQALLDKERQSWNEYLSEYGTFQEKKEAITAEYNDKISNASTKGEKESLKKELENRIKEINLDELKASINFADIFGDLDAQSTEALTGMRDKLKEVIEKSAKDLKPTDLKALQDAFKDIDIKVSERNPFGELKQGVDDYRNSTQAVIKAQEDLNTVQQGGAVIVRTYLDATGKICTKLLTQEQAEKNLSDAQRSRLEAQAKLSKSVNTIGQQGQQIVQAGSGLTNMLTDLGISIPESVKGALDGVGQVMDSMASIDLMKPMSILTGITGMLAGIGKTIGSIFGGSSNGTKVYEDMKEQLSAINEIYEKIIANSKEEIIFGGGFSSIQAANDALDTYYKKIQNYRKIAAAGGEAGASVGSHSYAHRANKRLSGDWGSISNVIGQNISSVQEMYNLTGEQLYLIQTKFPEAWRKIPSEISDSLSAIIECKDEAGELAEALNSAMTGIDTDSFYSGFIDSLSDMDTSFEDMCDNFEGYLRKSIIAGLVANQYQGRIDSLYKKWSDAAVSDKKITEEESNALQDEYKKIVEEMMKDREDMANSFGWISGESTSQNSTKGGFESMSQDTGNELNGRFTAFQISNEEIKNSMLSMLVSMNLLSVSVNSNGITLIEIRNLVIISNGYLEDIAGFQKRIVNEFGSKLESIDKGIQKFNGK